MLKLSGPLQIKQPVTNIHRNMSKRKDMKKTLLLVTTMMMLTVFLFGQEYIPVDNGSTVKFRIKNFGLAVAGTFTGLQGIIVFNAANLPSCSFDVSIDASSIETGIGLRNSHLRKEDYFDVKQYPRISFVSARVTPSTQAGTLYLFGKLTIKGITKDIAFPFTAASREDGYLFAGDFKINRRDFKVGGNNTIADSLTVSLQVSARKK